MVVHDPATDLTPVVRTEARVFLLYSTRKEAEGIMREANHLGLTGKSYVWIATQAVIGSSLHAPEEFPVGMLGVHFKTDRDSMLHQIEPAMTVFGHALNSLTKSKMTLEEKKAVVKSNVSCNSREEVRWWKGETFFKYLKNVKVKAKNGTGGYSLEFQSDGSKRYMDLRIVNLQPHDTLDSKHLGRRWEEIGVWQVSENDVASIHFTTDSNMTLNTSGKVEDPKTVGRIDIKDIVWPGGALKPPEGIPEKRFVRVSFLEEDPYVMLGPPTSCGTNKGAICQLKGEEWILKNNINVTEEKRKPNSSVFACCTGFCVDLLTKFAQDLSFDFQMVRVADGKWGGIVNGKWNGLVAELINHETDIVMTALKINSGREKVIDFSVPFLETGITILVAKRTGIISPTAFLEPFDLASWMLVVLVAIQVAAGCIFLFEWLSPSGYNMQVRFFGIFYVAFYKESRFRQKKLIVLFCAQTSKECCERSLTFLNCRSSIPKDGFLS